MTMDMQPRKVGVLSCSGEAEAEGTICRNAVRLVIEKYRPEVVTTLCLPLYLAGDSGEREFAKKFPVISVDGCGKLCAKRATEEYSGAVEEWIDLRELMAEWGVTQDLSRSHPGKLEDELAERLAREIVDRIDAIISQGKIVER